MIISDLAVFEPLSQEELNQNIEGAASATAGAASNFFTGDAVASSAATDFGTAETIGILGFGVNSFAEDF